MNVEVKVQRYTERTFSVNGITLALKCWGDNSLPPILALHGWLDNAATYDALAPMFNNHYFVAVDFAGHGLSDHRGQDASYYLWDHAIDVCELVDLMAWDRFTIVAHSMGTGVASVLSSINKKIDKIIFLDGMGAPFYIEEGQTVQHIQRSYRLRKMSRKRCHNSYVSNIAAMFNTKDEAIEKRMDGVGGRISHQASEMLVSRDLTYVNNEFRWRHDPRLILPESMQLTKTQALEFLKNIEVPLCVLLGVSGLFFGEAYSERAGSLPKNSRVHWVEGGHHFHLEKLKSSTLDQINNFLEEN